METIEPLGKWRPLCPNNVTPKGVWKMVDDLEIFDQLDQWGNVTPEAS
jgi:hypothetical protein